MIRGLGCLLILSGGVGAEVLHARASRRLLETLEGFSALFERMETEIRLNRTPLVQLMRRLLPGTRREVRQFLGAAVQAAERGASLPGAWRRESGNLTADAHTRSLIREVGDKLCGDEESACRALRLAAQQLAAGAEKLRRERGDKERRAAVLYVSAAAFLVILLL